MSKYSENWYEQHSYNVARFAASGTGLTKETSDRLDAEENMRQWEWLEKHHLDIPFKIGIIAFLVFMTIHIIVS